MVNQIYFNHLLPALKNFECTVVISNVQVDGRFNAGGGLNLEATANLVGESYSTDEIILGEPHIINEFYYQKVI